MNVSNPPAFDHMIGNDGLNYSLVVKTGVVVNVPAGGAGFPVSVATLGFDPRKAGFLFCKLSGLVGNPSWEGNYQISVGILYIPQWFVLASSGALTFQFLNATTLSGVNPGFGNFTVDIFALVHP